MLRNALTLTASPQGEAKESVRGRTFNNLSFDLSALCGLYLILPTASTYGGGVASFSGGQGASPLQLFLFLVFLSPEKEKRIGDDAVGKTLLIYQNTTPIHHTTILYHTPGQVTIL